jgi:hypothetical protein
MPREERVSCRNALGLRGAHLCFEGKFSPVHRGDVRRSGDGWLALGGQDRAKRLSVLFLRTESRARPHQCLVRGAPSYQISRSALLAECATGELHSSVEVLETTCRFTPENLGDGFIRIGEANYTLRSAFRDRLGESSPDRVMGRARCANAVTPSIAGSSLLPIYREQQADAIHAPGVERLLLW